MKHIISLKTSGSTSLISTRFWQEQTKENEVRFKHWNTIFIYTICLNWLFFQLDYYKNMANWTLFNLKRTTSWFISNIWSCPSFFEEVTLPLEYVRVLWGPQMRPCCTAGVRMRAGNMSNTKQHNFESQTTWWMLLVRVMKYVIGNILSHNRGMYFFQTSTCNLLTRIVLLR